jgi:hypothetical protein
VSTLQATDTEHLARAISLAEEGRGQTSPNPLVGAVIVRDGHVLGEGFHAALGEPHAERAATSPSASATTTPSSRRIPSPRPEAFSVGSSEATTTRANPASRIASVHGGVRPVWQHGSSET